MLASSFGDPVLGIDVHLEMVPTPAPVPTPIPNPFTGVIFDPIGLAAGLALGNAIGAVLGEPFKGPVIFWSAFPATNTGTEAKHVPGHILIPPGTSWAPCPKTPKPVIHPGETPDPPNPVKPEDDAVCIFGSKTVSVMGSNAVRMGDLLLSCSEPVRLPSSAVVAVPKGKPILIGGPPSLDLMAAITGSLRTRFMSDALHALVSRLKPSRFRNLLHRAACFLTGHPVDVATGKTVTDFVDVDLPGPLPLKIERVYSSAFASREGPLGYGWNYSLNQGVWRECGQVVYLAEDGREIVFDAFDYPGHTTCQGQSLVSRIERLTLHDDGAGKFRIVDINRITRVFSPVPGRADGRSMLVAIKSEGGHHRIVLEYDGNGRLHRVRDCGGRQLVIGHNGRGRVTSLSLDPGTGALHPVRRYDYDEHDDLVSVTDARDHRWSFEYQSHLLTRETDRNGLSFFFAYDGMGEDAWCVRTWGDEGIYDHVLNYDKKNHVTFVTDSTGQVRQYHMNLGGLVVKMVDPLGAEQLYEYDLETLQPTAYVDPTGAVTRRRYDAHGRLVAVEYADGATAQMDYDPRGHLMHGVDERGGQWHCAYDGDGHMTAMTAPNGATSTWRWSAGLPVEHVQPGGVRTHVRYDAAKNLVRCTGPAIGDAEYRFDGLGRLVGATVNGASSRLSRDPEGNVVRRELQNGLAQEASYDPEGNLKTWRDSDIAMAYRYGHFHRVEVESRGGAVTRFEYDTEDRLVAILDPMGSRHHFEYDPAGWLAAEEYCDGRRRSYARNEAGFVTMIREPSLRITSFTHDVAQRVVAVDHGDGQVTELSYEPDGSLASARNQSTSVTFERDPFGRVLTETGPDGRFTSAYSALGDLEAQKSSLGLRVAAQHRPDGACLALHVIPPTDLEAEVRFERDGLGRELTRTLSAGLVVQWARDPFGRPSQRRTLRRAGERWEQTEARTFFWQGAARLVERTTTSAVPTETTQFSYDAAVRLIAARAGQQVQTRAVDQEGNVFESGTGDDRTYGPDGRLLTVGTVALAYDEDGYLVERGEADGARWTYGWLGGALARAECSDGRVMECTYDPFGRRVRKRVGRRLADGQLEVHDDTRFVWRDQHVIHELSSARGTTTWVWEPETFNLVGMIRGDQLHAVIGDELGTPSQIYDPKGALVWQMRLDIVGRPTFDVGTAADCPWRHPGVYADDEVALLYAWNRYLGPERVFISPDPLSLLGGPLQYRFVDNPLLEYDPYGLHNASAWLNNRPVNNPATGRPFWRNVHGSGSNAAAPSGLGRLGDSENLILEHLEGNNRSGLRNGVLEITSLGENVRPGLNPCDLCADGLQRIANDYNTTILYTRTHMQGNVRISQEMWLFRRNQPPQRVPCS